MQIVKRIAVKTMLSGTVLVLAVLLLPAFIIPGQIDEFQKIVDLIFKYPKA